MSLSRATLHAVVGGQLDDREQKAKAIGEAARKQSLTASCSGYEWLGSGALFNCAWRNGSKAVRDGVEAMAKAGYSQAEFDQFGNLRRR